VLIKKTIRKFGRIVKTAPLSTVIDHFARFFVVCEKIVFSEKRSRAYFIRSPARLLGGSAT